MKRFLLLTALLLGTVSVLGQDLYSDIQWESQMKLYIKQAFDFTGKVYGTDQYEPKPYPLQGASVRMTCLGDTTMFDGMAASEQGEFWIYLSSRSRLKDTRVHVIVSYLGMETLDTIVQPVSKKENGIDRFDIGLDSICLHSIPATLQEVEIVEELQRMYQHGDTVIFNAGAYEMPTGSVLLDLVRRLPGLQYTNGALSYLGRSIEEIRLNGDHFFERDMSIALNNMPTDKLKSLKVYEVPDDTLNVHSDNHLIMDMETSEPMDHTLFASISAGTNETFDKFSADVSAADWRQDKGSIYGYYSRSNIPDTWNIQLESENQNGNIYYSRQFKEDTNLDISGSYSDNYSRSKSTNLSKTYMPDYTQNSSSGNESWNGSDSWNGSIGANGRAGRHGNWNVSANASVSHSDSESQNTDTLSNDGQGLISSTAQKDLSNSETRSIDFNSNYYQSFGEDSKYSLSASLNFSLSNTESSSNNTSESRFYQLGDSTRLIRHRILSPADDRSIDANVSLDRQIGKNGWLGLIYGMYYFGGTSGSTYSDILPDDSFQSVDSLNYTRENFRFAQNLSVNFNYSDSTFRISARGNVAPSVERTDSRLWQQDENLEQKSVIYNAYTQIRFHVFKLSQLEFNYNCSSRPPEIEQMSKVTDYRDPMNVSKGNSNLKRSFQQTVGMEFQLKSWMRIQGQYGTTMNQISTLTMIDRQTGARHTSPANINGNWNCNESLFLTYPFRDLSLSFNVAHSLRHNVSYVQGFTDAAPSTSSSDYNSINCSLNTGYSNKNWMLQASGGYSIDRNKSDYISSANGGQRVNGNINLEYTSDMGLGASTDFTLNKPFGYELASANRTECLWNISATYSFLKSKQAEIRLMWRDILNDYTGFNTSVSSTGWNESRTYGNTSMFILSFSYRFNQF